jgi:hypothetical protein
VPELPPHGDAQGLDSVILPSGSQPTIPLAPKFDFAEN